MARWGCGWHSGALQSGSHLEVTRCLRNASRRRAPENTTARSPVAWSLAAREARSPPPPICSSARPSRSCCCASRSDLERWRRAISGRTRKVERRRERPRAVSDSRSRRSLAMRSTSGTRIGGTRSSGAPSSKTPRNERTGRTRLPAEMVERGRREDAIHLGVRPTHRRRSSGRWPRGLGEYFASSWSMISIRRRRCQSPAQSRAKQPGLPPRARSSQSRSGSQSAPPFFSLRAPSGGAVVSGRPRRDRCSSTHTARVAFRARRWRP